MGTAVDGIRINTNGFALSRVGTPIVGCFVSAADGTSQLLMATDLVIINP